MSSYLSQGMFPLRESQSAVVIAEKDKPVKLFAYPEATGLVWGMWETPDAENDESMEPPPLTA